MSERGGESNEVSVFLQSLKHGRKNEVEAVREIILSADTTITERIKWNAPSFCIDGDDRITFRLQPKDQVQLVFHRGSRKRDDADGFSFEDPSRLLEWASGDRALLTFLDLADVGAKSAAVRDLVARWMAATRDPG